MKRMGGTYKGTLKCSLERCLLTALLLPALSSALLPAA